MGLRERGRASEKGAGATARAGRGRARRPAPLAPHALPNSPPPDARPPGPAWARGRALLPGDQGSGPASRASTVKGG